MSQALGWSRRHRRARRGDLLSRAASTGTWTDGPAADDRDRPVLVCEPLVPGRPEAPGVLRPGKSVTAHEHMIAPPQERADTMPSRLWRENALLCRWSERGRWYFRNVNRGADWLRTVVTGVVDQMAFSSSAIAAMSCGTSEDARSCMASATTSTAAVESWRADSPLCRLVQRRACTCRAWSAKITSVRPGCSTWPEKVR
jgi:hypothetical protein